MALQLNTMHSAVKIGVLGAMLLCGSLHAEEGEKDCNASNEIGHDYSILMGDADEVVPLLYRHVGLLYDVPYKILYAVGLQESRRPGGIRPWPWTLNINREGYYFNCRNDALNAIVKAQSEGLRSIDVGLGQVNLRWNGHLFTSLEEALDPMSNLEAATQVLRREFDACYAMTGRPDWWCAVGRYHSGGNTEEQRARAQRYSNSVYALWESLE